MRVIAGRFKTHLLKAPKGGQVRPTSQKVKGALFNILGRKICGSCFLELFAGSGNIAIEALSRGAKKVLLVEKDRSCLRVIAANLKQLNIAYKYGFSLRGPKPKPQVETDYSVTILPLDAQKAVKLASQKRQRFDIIFLDPPYAKDVPFNCAQGEDTIKNCLIKISLYDILKPHSLVIAEHKNRQVLPQRLSDLSLTLTKNYGDCSLSFYQTFREERRKQ